MKFSFQESHKCFFLLKLLQKYLKKQNVSSRYQKQLFATTYEHLSSELSSQQNLG
ncbi:hypothetical protein pb186bvf_011275 [Paramecium bursaria]